MTKKISLSSILHAGKSQLVGICKALGVSSNGSEEQLRERVIREIFPIEPGDEREPRFTGKLNINNARSDQFLLWPYLGKTTIQNIMEYRQKFGKFHHIEELLNVKGIGIKTFGILRKFLTTKGKTTLKIRRDDEEIEDYLQAREIVQIARKREHELKDWEETIEFEHEEIEEQQEEIRKEQEELKEKEQAIVDRENEIAQLRLRLDTKEGEIEKGREELLKKEDALKVMEAKTRAQQENIKELKGRVEKTYGEIDAGKLVPRKTVDGMISEFKKSEDEMKLSSRKLLDNYNTTREELVALLEENEELRQTMVEVSRKQGEITRIQTELRKSYDENIIEQKELRACKENLSQRENALKTARTELLQSRKHLEERDRELKVHLRELGKRQKALERREDIFGRKQVLYGRINLNHATVEELALWPHITPAIAQEIVAYRKKFNGFRKTEEILNVSGVGERTYRILAPFITFSGPTGIEFRREKDVVSIFTEVKKNQHKEISKAKAVLKKRLQREEKALKAWERELKDTQRRVKRGESKLLKETTETRARLQSEAEELTRQRLDMEQMVAAYNQNLALTGTLNINRATKEELALWPGFSVKVIADFLKHRKEFGRFRRLEELKSVSGIGEETYKHLLPFLSLSGDTGLKIELDPTQDAALTELLKLEEELVELKKQLRFRQETLEYSYSEKEARLEATFKAQEQQMRAELRQKEKERAEAMVGKEKMLVTRFLERQQTLEEKYRERTEDFRQSRDQFREESGEMKRQIKEQKALLEAKEKELTLNIEAYGKELVLHARININQASREELCLWPGITPALAKAIIAHREKYQAFKKKLELLDVKGIGKETYRHLAPFVVLSGPTGVEFRQKDRVTKVFDEMGKERKELETLKKQLLERKGALNELYEEKEREEFRLREMKNEYEERKRAIDEIYEERIKLKYEAQREKEVLVSKQEELDVIYLEKETQLQQEFGKRKGELTEEMQKRRAELEEEFQDRHQEMVAEFQEKENFYNYQVQEMERKREHISEREVIQERGAILFGKINLNKASRGELLLWPHITPAIADNIISYRKKYTSFRDVDELKEVKGIGSETFQILRPFVDIKGQTGFSINEGFSPDTILDDLEEQKTEMQEAKHDLHVRKRELEWEYQELFGETEKRLATFEKQLEADRTSFEEEITSREENFKETSTGKETQLHDWETVLYEKEQELKALKADLRRLDQKLKRRGTYLDELDGTLYEREAVIEKEATLFGKLNINKAPRDELLLWPHITGTVADEIIAYREKHRFRRLEELKEVQGIGEESYHELRPFVALSGKGGLKINVDENIQTLVDDLEGRRLEMVEARRQYHQTRREFKDEYHEKVELGLKDIEKAKKELGKEQRSFQRGQKTQEKEQRKKLKDMEAREKKLLELEEIAAMNAVLLGSINLNTATQEELAIWPQISPAIADNIIKYREKFGEFRKVEEMKGVKGIGEETYKLLRPFVTLSGSTGLSINTDDPRTQELREIEDNIQKSAESYQKKSELLDDSLDSIIELKDAVDEDKYKLKQNAAEVQELRNEMAEQEEKGGELLKKMEGMQGTLGTLLTGGKLDGISVRALLPKEELEAFEGERQHYKNRVEEINDFQKKLDEERRQLGFASKFRVKIPLEIEVGDDSIENDKIIIKDEDGDFVKEVLLVQHGKRTDVSTYAVVIPEIPAGRRYTILHDTGEDEPYVIARNYPAKVVEE